MLDYKYGEYECELMVKDFELVRVPTERFSTATVDNMKILSVIEYYETKKVETEIKNVDWKIALENLLIQFPTILDETAKYEAGSGIVHPIDADGIYVPCHYKFQDLDGDNIPEAIITYAHPESEWIFDKVYKLYGDSYLQITLSENINNMTMFVFYTNIHGNLVAAKRSGYTINGIYFAEVQNKKLILSDFIDSNGNDSYNGVKYDSFSEWDATALWDAADADETLRLLPEIDCFEVVNAARIKIYN